MMKKKTSLIKFTLNSDQEMFICSYVQNFLTVVQKVNHAVKLYGGKTNELLCNKSCRINQGWGEFSH